MRASASIARFKCGSAAAWSPRSMSKSAASFQHRCRCRATSQGSAQGPVEMVATVAGAAAEATSGTTVVATAFLFVWMPELSSS